MLRAAMVNDTQASTRHVICLARSVQGMPAGSAALPAPGAVHTALDTRACGTLSACESTYLVSRLKRVRRVCCCVTLPPQCCVLIVCVAMCVPHDSAWCRSRAPSTL